MKHWSRYVLGVLAGTICLSAAVFAADQKVAETYTGEDTISVYLRDVSADADLKVQIGTSSAEVKKAELLAESSVPIRTLVMIDNSVSIKQAQQERIGELVQDLIGGAAQQEQIALATFGEDISYLCDYSGQYGELKQALTDITYGDQETYLTDVLYSVLTEDIEKDPEENFHRIVIISDGVDNKPVGITKEELYQHIREHMIPIYTIGCKEKGNEEALENMFALARITGTEPYVLDEVENTLDIVNALAEDRNILCVRIMPDGADMDGGQKTVKISTGDESIQAEMRMPQQELPKESQEEAEPEKVPEPAAEPEREEPEAADEEGSRLPVVLAGILSGLAFLLVIIALILLFRKKKTDRPHGFEPYRPSGQEPRQEPDNREGRTVLLGGSRRKYDLLLEDMDNPARSHQAQISENAAAVIGRSENCDICIGYDAHISGKHCEIGIEGDTFYVKDLRSSNGTFLNGNRVITSSELIAGNVLRIGTVQFRVNIR